MSSDWIRDIDELETERTIMIRWNKWTKDYTYTYLWHDGVWKLIHKKSNKPVESWFRSCYKSIRNRLINDISSQRLKV